MGLPKPKECADCGGGPVFHRISYSTIFIDELIGSLFEPGPIMQAIAKPFRWVERRVTPSIFDFFIAIGLAKRVTEPDDGTQLLALMLWNEAKERGIRIYEWRLFDLPRNLFVATYPSGRRMAYEGIPFPLAYGDAAPWMDNKAELKKRFRKLGVPIAEGGEAFTLAGARRIYKRVTPPVIIKPHSGSGSRHTVLHIDNEQELERAFRVAKQVSPLAVIEEELVGPVYRATVVEGRFAAALRRDPPHVLGNGTSTVRELVEEANKHPGRSGPYFSKLILDDNAEQELRWQEYTVDSVIPAGKRAYLHQKVNWGVGGTTADATDDVHPENVALFEKVAKVLKAPIVGIDFIIADMSRSWKEQERCGILECNSMPFFDNHHLPFEGEARNIAALIWDMNEKR
jgi:D-alanine-D-alanine ligase-like ATP-grasp enzyme